MGFDNECIVNIQSLAGEYFCPVCRLLVYPNEALQSLCTHLYCKPCLTYIVGTTRACPYDGYLVTEADSKPLLESNKTLAETIGNVLVHCLYQKSGCTWQGPLSDCTSHCAGCAFGNSQVLCNRCSIQILHCQVHEHAHSCPGVQQTQAAQFGNSQVVAAAASTAPNVNISQATAAVAHHNNRQASANLQTPDVSAGSSSAGQWYQQTNKQYYQQYSGAVLNQEHQYVQQDFIQNPQQHTHSRPPQQTPALMQQQIQLQPQDQTRPKFQTQPYLQSQVQPQLHTVIQAAPGSQSLNQTMVSTHSQAQPSVSPYSLVPTQSHPSSQGHTNLEAQPNSYPQTYQQAQVQHTQIPQFQQLPEKLNRPAPHSQTNHPLRPQAQVLAGPQSYPQQQPNKQTQFGVLPSNMHAAHHGGIQQAVLPVQVQNQYPQKLPDLRSPQSHFPIQNQQQPAQGQYPSFPPTQQHLPHPNSHPNSHPAVVSAKHHVMRPVQQSPLQQHLARPSGGIHQLMHQQSAGMHQQVALQSQLRPQIQPQFTRQYPPSVQPQQSVTNHGLQQQPHQPSAGAFQGREEHRGPNYPAAVKVDNQRTENNLSLVSEGKYKDHRSGTAERAEDDIEAKSISGAAETESLNAENGLRSSDETKGQETLKSELNTNTNLEHNSTRSEEPVTKQMVEDKSPAILTNSENHVLSENQTKDSLAVETSLARETDHSEEKMGITNSDRMLTQMQPASIINESSNNRPVDHVPSTFLQRDAQDRASHNFHTPGQPPSVFGPHSPDIIVGSIPHLPSASSSDRESSRFGLAHPTSVGPYPQGQSFPSHNSKISSDLTNPPVAIGLRDQRFMPFPDGKGNHTSYHGPVMESGRHIDDPRNSMREYPGMSSRTNGLSQGAPGERFLGMDATDSREPHRFGFPSHLHRQEFVGLADVMPSHMRKDQVAFAGFPPSRPGEPGFRSKFSLQRFPDGGPFAGDMEPLGSLGKRKPTSIWWCRICKFDCETDEGLDLHSQSKEHQKRSMDIVEIIKQNAKKHKPLPGKFR